MIMKEQDIEFLNLDELVKNLNRWAVIAEHTHNNCDWDACSLLHSFGNQLARDLRKAVGVIKETKVK